MAQEKASPVMVVQNWPVETDHSSKRLLSFVQGSQAARADLNPLALAFCVDRDLLDVRLPLALGLYVGVTDIVPKRWGLAAHFTFRHDRISPT
jgi:hypothetical protein